MTGSETRSEHSRRQSRRIWWIMALLMVVLLAVIGWLLVFHDGPPPDMSDVVPRWSDRGGVTNPLAVFCLELKANGIADYDRLPEDVRHRREGTDAVMRQFLERHEGLFVAFDRLMKTDQRIWQWPRGPRVSEVESGVYAYADNSMCSAFASLLRAKIWLLNLDGQASDAVDLSLQKARFGKGLQGAEGCQNGFLIGYLTQKTAEIELKQPLTHSAVMPDLLRRCLRGLDELGGPRSSDYQFMMRAECLLFRNVLPKTKRRDLWSSSSARVHDFPFDRFMLGALYKQNLTLAARLDLDRPIIDALGTGWGEGYRAQRNSQKVLDDFCAAQDAKAVPFDLNLGGMLMLDRHWPYGDSAFFIGVVESVILHDQVEVMLALRLFELEKRALPKDLNDLVPEYLTEVPKDIFGSKPMMWNHNLCVLYSVGKDVKDDGGSVVDEKPNRGPDLGFRYWWSKPMPKSASD